MSFTSSGHVTKISYIELLHWAWGAQRCNDEIAIGLVTQRVWIKFYFLTGSESALTMRCCKYHNTDKKRRIM